MGDVYLVDGGGSRGVAGLGKRGGERYPWVAVRVGSIFGWNFCDVQQSVRYGMGRRGRAI